MADGNTRETHDTTRLRREMEARRQEMLKSVEESREKLKGLLRPSAQSQDQKSSE